MFNSKQDLLNGNPYRCIIAFAIPLFIGNIFQQLYNVVDAAVVGRFVGLKALAAVGAGASGNGLIIAIILGISNGASVVISQVYGTGIKEKLRKSYNHLQDPVDCRDSSDDSRFFVLHSTAQTDGNAGRCFR